MPRYIFITGGVVSSLGKGLASAALGALLRPAAPHPPPEVGVDGLTPHLRRNIGLPPEAAHARLEALPPLMPPV